MTKRVYFALILLLSMSFSYTQVTVTCAEDAVAVALHVSEKYILQKQQALVAIKNAKYSIAGFLPQLSLNWSESDSIKYAAADSRTKSIQAGIIQPIFNGGKNKLAYDMAKLSASYQYDKYNLDVKNYSASIIQSYYEYLSLLSKVETTRFLLENAEAQLLITKSEYELGMALESAYLEYLISVMGIRDNLKQTEREARTALRSFKILIGLDVETELIISENSIPEEKSEFMLEPYSEFIWHLVKNSNIELHQQQISLEYSKKELEYNRRIYLPKISLEGNVSFSGQRYPLTQPGYGLKVHINFESNPFLPLSFSTNNNFNSKGRAGVSNTSNSSVTPPTTYFTSRKSDSLSYKQSRNALDSTTQTLEEDVFEKISTHDDCLDSIKLTRETLKLQEKRLEIGKIEMEKGEKKRIDQLKDLQKHAEEQIKLSESLNLLICSWYQLELLTDIPLGELKNVCLSSNN